ncbi:hypothetical protein [Vulcanisaeta distributa]|uniref:hypothetical protein n=1 Tax=Vulcanisaeta distributa TaxID=164451 RepID=UPI000AD2B8CA|nr:hypothetical protein [Vulcanisaeta distributa]
MHLHVTNRQLRSEHREPYNLITIEVDPEVKPRTSTTTLRKCAEEFGGVKLEVIREGGFKRPKYDQLLEGVWECIGKP